MVATGSILAEKLNSSKTPSGWRLTVLTWWPSMSLKLASDGDSTSWAFWNASAWSQCILAEASGSIGVPSA